MKQTEKQHKIGIQILLHHFLEVKLHVAQPRNAAGIAQQAQLAAIGNQAVQVFAVIEVLLHHGVRRNPELFVFGAFVQRFVVSANINGETIQLAVAVNNRKCFSVDFFGLAHKVQVKAQVGKERNQPEITGFGGSRFTFFQA